MGDVGVRVLREGVFDPPNGRDDKTLPAHRRRLRDGRSGIITLQRHDVAPLSLFQVDGPQDDEAGEEAGREEGEGDGGDAEVPALPVLGF